MEGAAAESQENSSPISTSHSEGEALASVATTTEDLYAVYLHGLSHPSPPQQQQSLNLAATYPVSFSNTMLLHAVTNNAIINYQNLVAARYLLPQPFYSLAELQRQYSSPRHRALITAGNLLCNPPPALPSRVLRVEGIPNANNVSAGGGSTYVGESSTQGASRHKFFFNRGTDVASENDDVPPDIAAMSNAMSIVSTQRRMISQSNANVQGESFLIFDTSGERYTIYDNKYEEIGLPMDPHIRAFLANNGNGNHMGGSTSKT